MNRVFKSIAEEDTIEYTKMEQRVVDNPICALAAAVIWQWHKDGEPESGVEAIQCWRDLFYQGYKWEEMKVGQAVLPTNFKSKD